MNSKTLGRVLDEFREREALGLAKYNTTVDRTDLTRKEWLQHLKEELMDATLYIQRSIDLLEEISAEEREESGYP